MARRDNVLAHLAAGLLEGGGKGLILAGKEKRKTALEKLRQGHQRGLLNTRIAADDKRSAATNTLRKDLAGQASTERLGLAKLGTERHRAGLDASTRRHQATLDAGAANAAAREAQASELAERASKERQALAQQQRDATAADKAAAEAQRDVEQERGIGAKKDSAKLLADALKKSDKAKAEALIKVAKIKRESNIGAAKAKAGAKDFTEAQDRIIDRHKILNRAGDVIGFKHRAAARELWEAGYKETAKAQLRMGRNIERLDREVGFTEDATVEADSDERQNPTTKTPIGDFGGRFTSPIEGESRTDFVKRRVRESEAAWQKANPETLRFGSKAVPAATPVPVETAPAQGGTKANPINATSQAIFDTIRSGEYYRNPSDGKVYRKK